MLADTLTNLGNGFSIALQPQNLLFSFVGAFLGTIIGILPGIGPAGAIALILPVIYTLDPVGAIIMLASTYAGAMYGRSTTSILLNVPGESSSVVTCLDGHQMALQGRAGPALCIAAIGSYIAGTLGVLGLMLLGPLIADSAIWFGPPEYFALMLFGLSAVSSLAGESIVKGLIAIVIGLVVSTVSLDITGVVRFNFDNPDLIDGITFLTVPIGLFAISEVLMGVQEMRSGVIKKLIKHRLFISLKEITESIGAILRGSFIGFFVGVLPGAGAGIASFIAYSLETQVSGHPERFGKGEIRGVAAPQSANNAASVGALIPMLSLGVPGSGTTAIMLAALLALDVQPGPFLWNTRPDLIWGLVAALYLGNIMLVILNLPLVGIFVRILYLPLRFLFPIILILSVIGVYSENHSTIDLIFLCGFGLLGFYMRRNGYPVAPVILGVVLGERMETALRQSMIMSLGDPVIFLERPISAFFILLALISFAVPFILRHFNKGGAIEQDE